MPFVVNKDPLIRLTDPNYADGVGSVVQGTDPVDISATLFDQDGDMPNTAGLSNMFVAWGQFLDHDITLSLENHAELLTADGLVAPLERSEYVIGEDGARVPTNALTWQIDGSQIYGSSSERTNDLRSFEGGKLRMSDDPTSDKGLMPTADPDSFMAGDITSDDPVFLSGDIRANENPALASVHTVMAREHNYWAERLAEAHPDWTDDQLFDSARQIVSYEVQSITYNEWLPHLLGDAVGDDTGYDPDVNGQISVEFSTAAFRFGHTMVSSTLPRINDDGSDTDEGDLAIMDAFFNAEPLKSGDLDAILRGQLTSSAQEFDTKVVDDLNFFLSSPAGVSGFSLVALNLLRGQDHGLQSYVDTRAALLGDIDPDTLDPLDFSIITSDPAQQAALAEVYDTVHDVDLWVGGLAEDPIGDTQFGPMFTYIVSDQFTRIRAADPEFGQLDPAIGADIIAEVKSSGLNDIIMRTTGVDAVQDDPFIATPMNLDDADAPEKTVFDDDFDLVSQHIVSDVETGAGNDSITIRGGTIVDGDVHLGSGDDDFTQTSGTVTGDVRLGSGDDTAYLGSDGEILGDLFGGSGNDTITVDDFATIARIRAGAGDDTVEIGENTSTPHVQLGSGDDVVTVNAGADIDIIKGGSGTDTLDVKGSRFRVDYKDGNPDTHDGEIVYLDANGVETGDSFAFQSVENVTCFTGGSLILTPDGDKPIETLQVGDAVITRDHGAQAIRWIGTTTVAAHGDLAPISFAENALGTHAAFDVSPQHRMLLSGWRCELASGTKEALAPAKHLINDTTIRQIDRDRVTYIHLAFDQHEVICGNGAWSESFHPGSMALDTLSAATRAELFRLFPQVAVNPINYGPSARPQMKFHEARMILPS
nr:peroxidase family protein [Yoonia ponticola]